jgi:hypothetical protein
MSSITLVTWTRTACSHGPDIRYRNDRIRRARSYEENREHLQRVFGGDLVWEIWLFNQPANSPDLNMNGLAFFVSTKAEYWKDPAQTLGGMIVKMAEIYENYPGRKLSSGFMTLQIVMNQIIEHDGGNEF